jgi:hypothetical protein
MKVELPKTIKAKDNKITLGYKGHIEVPDTFTGGDFEKFFKAANQDEIEDIYEQQWLWAKELIVEWAIEGLPTNPNQLKDGDITWALQSFLVRSVIDGMNKYMTEDVKDIKEQIDYPVPDNLLPNEFLAWQRAYKKAELERKEEGISNMRLAWLAGSVLVREWPNGGEPKDYESADLKLIKAIDQLLPETITPALDLGNWRVPLGEV